MNCAWKSYLNLLPVGLRQEVEGLGYDSLLEVRLRCGQAAELVTVHGSVWLNRVITREDLRFTVNIASQYSAWTSGTAAYGYITAAGGHRIGLCGQAVADRHGMTGIREPTSLCIRVAKDVEGVAKSAAQLQGSILILGRPGSGKTTFLRDLIRQKSRQSHVTVVDERQELFPQAAGTFCFDPGQGTDILSCCDKAEGILAAIRCMNPDYVAVDEITAQEDCNSLLHAGWCGVSLMATAHAGSKEDLFGRPVYKPLVEKKLFQNLVIMGPGRSFRIERIRL